MRVSSLLFTLPTLNDAPCLFSEVIESKDGKDAPTSTFSNASKNAHVEFNEKFQREANEYDKDIFKRYGDLDTTLIFVSSSFRCAASFDDPDYLGASRLGCYRRSRPCSSLTYSVI